MASGESKGSRRYDKENLLWQSGLTLLLHECRGRIKVFQGKIKANERNEQ